MKTREYLEEAKRKTGLVSDYALGKRLGVTKQAMSGYATGNRIMDDYTAAKVAELLGINELEVIAAANAEREKDSAKAEFWRRLATRGKAAGFTGALILAGFLAIDQVLSLDILYIMRNLIVYVILILGVIGLTYKLWESHHATKSPF